MKPSAHKDKYMKNFNKLLLLVTITILLASCGSLSDFYSEKYGEDWAASNT